MSRILLISALGALGALARYGLNERFHTGNHWLPWGTLIANVTGAFLLGLVSELSPSVMSTTWKIGIAVGLLGAFTTFSTLMLEFVASVQTGHPARAVGYLGITLAAGLMAVVVGMASGRMIA